jgi:hypothetical protein
MEWGLTSRRINRSSPVHDPGSLQASMYYRELFAQIFKLMGQFIPTCNY